MKSTPIIFQGFSLLELLIVLAIMAILATLILPSYTPHITKMRRIEAEESLLKLAIAMEQYHLAHNSYQHATLANLNFPEWIVKNNYQLIIQSATDDDYLLLAKPLAKQADEDSLCASLLLDALGEKKITGTGHTDECW